MKQILSEEFRRMQKLAGIINESQLEEAANEDLELKSAAKQIFSVLKKYELKPSYEADGKRFYYNDPNQSFGARVHIYNGVMIVAVSYEGIWQTIRRKQKTNELDIGLISEDPSEREKQQINQIAGKIYNDIMSTLGKGKFEFKSQPKPNEYGYYIIQIRKKSTNPN
jgi:hypothetical protein